LKIRGVEINRGQYLRSYSKLAEDLEFKEGRGYKKVSKSTIKRSVQKLIDEGTITIHETDSGTVFTVVNYLEYQGIEDNAELISGTDSSTSTERTRNEDGTNPEQEQELKNLRIKELEEEKRSSDPFFLFENNICVLNNINRESLLAWRNDLGDDLVIAAIKLAAKYSAYSYKYVEDIFREWDQQNIKTVEDARFYIKEKDRRKSNTVPFRPKKTIAEDDGYDYGF
jgi:DnaD/phage-associated family protein